MSLYLLLSFSSPVKDFDSNEIPCEDNANLEKNAQEEKVVSQIRPDDGIIADLSSHEMFVVNDKANYVSNQQQVCF